MKNEDLAIKCNLCQYDTQKVYDKQFNIMYYQCENCEFIQMDELKQVSFKEERRIYDLHQNSLECEGYVNMFKDFLNKGVFPFKTEGKALDFGSGPEPVLSELIKRDYQFNIDYYDLHYQPEKIFENKKYDVILSTEVIEHVLNPLEIFRLLHAHLNEGGILAVMTLFHENNEESFIKWWYRRDETHISFYTLKTLQLIAERIGFKIIYTDNKRICTFEKLAT